MATTQINGGSQIQSATITNTQIAAAAAIATSKLAQGANFIQRDGSVVFTADQSFGGFKITSLADPVSATDAATKSYVDALVNGLDVKASCRVASTANVAIPPGGTSLAIDGVTLVNGDRVLLKDQTTGSQNGVYTVGGVGTSVTLTRAADADASAEVTGGLFTWITEGTANADTAWVLTTNDPITLGTTSLTFQQFSGAAMITAGAGLTKTGNTLDVVAADTSITVNADSIQVHLGDASLEVSSGLRVTHGSGGQVYLANASGVCTATTLSGDVSSVSNAGAVTLATAVMKTSNFVVRETPSGTVNGSNVTFTLANTPVSGTESVYLNGILQDAGAGNDYQISSATLTFNSAPLTGDKVRCSYLK